MKVTGVCVNKSKKFADVIYGSPPSRVNMSQMSIILRLDVLGSESKLPMNRVVETSKTVKFTVTLA